MTTKTHYQTDAYDIYTGPIDCQPDPEEEGRWWVPFGAYPDAPPPCQANEAAKRTADKTAWLVVPDFRGLRYWLPGRTTGVITMAGVLPPDGYLTADPGPTPAELLADLKKAARQALLNSDKVAARCMKFGVDYPQAWRARDATLVGVVNLPDETDPASVAWPVDVPYPAGTDWEV